MIKSHSRGWEIYFDKEQWRYCDDNSLLSQNPRPCKKCGKFPTPEGYDACFVVSKLNEDKFRVILISNGWW